MARSRSLLASLVVATATVAAVVPVTVHESARAERDAERLEGEVLAASDAVDEYVAASRAMLDILDRLLQGTADADAATINETLDRQTAEGEAWAAMERLLRDAGASDYDDAVEAARRRLLAHVNTLYQVYATGEDLVRLEGETQETSAASAGLREKNRVLNERVHAELVDPQVARVTASTARLRTALLIGLGSLLVFLLAAIVIVVRSTRRAKAEATRIEAERSLHARRTAFESSLMRALEMAKTEDGVFQVVEQAIAEGAPSHDAELLVADSSRAHFRRALAVGSIEAGCAVVSPLDCPASSRGQVMTFADDTAIDTCPNLRGRGCSATCVPVSVAGKATGVVHVTAPVGAPPDREVVVAIEAVAHRASERLAMVWAFEQTSAQANTDALTGLPNRRSLENRLNELQRSGQAYSLAYCDLDHFKQLNDLHGHETGDRALRLFARVLRDTVRPSDTPARYGGEEFILLLPDCTGDDAITTLERVRSSLMAALGHASVPPFTCSFGLATSYDGRRPEDVIAAADAALLEAKAAGRDRIVRAHASVDESLAELIFPPGTPTPTPAP